MRIIIVGGGIVGQSLAEHLLKEGHNLSLIELDDKLCIEVSEKLDLQVIEGSGSSPSVLKSAGVDSADMLLAVTPENDVNILSCGLAAQYGVKSRIARLRGREYSEEHDLVDLEKLGVTSVIQPERVLVDQIMQYVETPHAVESANFEDGRILLRGFRITDKMPLANKTPREIRQETDMQLLFAAIVRRSKGMIPDGDTVIEPGDILYTLFPRESLDKFLELVNIEKKTDRKIIITGSSYSTVELALRLDKTDHHVTLVDPDLEHANKIAGLFDKVEVLHGDCTHDDLLRELNVDKASFFIAVSDEADYNMLSSLLAKVEGAHEVISITSEWQHVKLFHSIGIDHVINPRLTTAREILEIISRGQIGAVVKLSDVDIEAIRFNVAPSSKMAGMQVKDVAVKLKKGSVIGVVVREGSSLLTAGEHPILANGHVIIITRHENLDSVNKLFKSGGIFVRN